jgi:glycosyltransferase involved in cell wall biosynthesis
VIVPVFNEAAYLGEALESILAQTMSAAEIIVVDDGSTDHSSEVARRFAPRVAYERQEHAGSGAARNRGVRLARSNLLAFLDADDLWMPDKLALQTQALQATPSLEAVFAHLEHFHSPDLPAERASRLPCPKGSMPCTTAVAMLIRRAAFDRVGGFDELGAIGEVVDWYLRAQSRGLVESTLPETLVRRRIHAGNTSLLRESERSRYVGIVKAALDRRRAAASSRNDS